MFSNILPLVGGGSPRVPAPNGPATQTAINVFGATGNESLRDLSSILVAINQPTSNGGFVQPQPLPTIQRAGMNWVPIALLIALGIYLIVRTGD